MAKLRSPNYPSISLKDALERVRKVYDSEHTHPASREVIAKDMGYNSLSGASLPIIGALRRYGMLEPAGEGLRVSVDVVSILELPEDDPERQAALRRVAFTPSLFSELHEEFGDKLPSDANLRHHLIKQKFLPKAADEAIRVYRDNLTLVGGGDLEYDSDREESMPPATEEQKLHDQKPPGGTPKVNQLATQVLAISIPRKLSVDINVKGDELKREDLAKIKNQFNRWIEGLEEAFEE